MKAYKRMSDRVVKTRSNLFVIAATIHPGRRRELDARGRALPVTCTTLVDMLIFAFPLAGIYAMSATGLVVVYTTTGIFNFAQGAIGMFLAYVDWELTRQPRRAADHRGPAHRARASRR